MGILRPSPVPYLTDQEYSDLKFSERVLHVARSQVGLEEIPRGSNSGKHCMKWLASCNIDYPAYWCAAFGTWCMVEAGLPREALPHGEMASSTLEWIRWAERKKLVVADPHRGCAGVVNTGRGGHYTLICEVKPKSIRTIEGNTNDDGSRDGYGVFERERTVGYYRSYKYHAFIDMDRIAALGGIQ